MSLFYLFSFILIVIGIVLLALVFFNGSFKLKKHTRDKYAILIPARDESKVIDNLLKSIEVQNKNMSNVYVIVEKEDDPTVNITKKYGANIFVRPKPIRPRKGYALDECLKDILKNNNYDLYFIFDADNILDKNFISKMLNVWRKGYDVAIGYRNILNPKNLVSCCSGLMFIWFNKLINKDIRMRYKKPIMISGTGFYVSGKLIKRWNGFPFYTLTEDYELSTYLYTNNIPSIYVEEAVYFDEQPLKMSISIKQRTRWIRGFFEKRKNIQKDEKYNFISKIGIIPIILILMGMIFLFISSVIDLFINNFIIDWWQIILLNIPTIIYGLFLLATLYVFVKENKRINLPKNKVVGSLLFMPLFLMSFVISFLRNIFLKEVKWDKIEHIGRK